MSLSLPCSLPISLSQVISSPPSYDTVDAPQISFAPSPYSSVGLNRLEAELPRFSIIQSRNDLAVINGRTLSVKPNVIRLFDGELSTKEARVVLNQSGVSVRVKR